MISPQHHARYSNALNELETITTKPALDDFMRRTITEDGSFRSWVRNNEQDIDSEIFALYELFSLIYLVYIEHTLDGIDPATIADRLKRVFHRYLSDGNPQPRH